MNHVWIGALAAIPFAPLAFIAGTLGAERLFDWLDARASRKLHRELGIPELTLDEIMRMYRR
jgi:hypothetical protein